jgi:FkbM family methyltransferase
MTSSRSAYVHSPLPIERELRWLFDPAASITIFDIGACEGEDAVRYARLFPNAAVYAVEPIPDNVARIHDTIARYGATTVTVLPLALSDSSGLSRMYVSSGSPPDIEATDDWDFGNKSSSLLAPDLHLEVHPWVRFNETISVETRRLDGICAERGIERVDFIHLDVQGAELMVLKGAGSSLSEVTAIWLEVEAVPLYRGQPLKGDVEEFLGARDFRKLKDTVGRVSGDQLWIHRAARRPPMGGRVSTAGRQLMSAVRRMPQLHGRGPFARAFSPLMVS